MMLPSSYLFCQAMMLSGNICRFDKYLDLWPNTGLGTSLLRAGANCAHWTAVLAKVVSHSVSIDERSW